jgi:hypothetical protein
MRNSYLSFTFLIALLPSCGTELPLPKLLESIVTWNDEHLASAGLAEANSYIVGLRLFPESQVLSLQSHQSQFAAHFDELSHLLDPAFGIEDYQFITTLNIQSPETSLQSVALKTLEIEGKLGWHEDAWNPDLVTIVRVDFDSAEEAITSITAWHEQGRLHFAEPNYLNNLSAIFDDAITQYDAIATFGNSWWLSRIQLKEAFTHIAGEFQTDPNKDVRLASRPPIIAIMDSGVDYGHPALAGKIWKNEREGASSCVRDLYGCNTTRATKGYLGTGDVHPFLTTGPGMPCPAGEGMGICGHGTHVAGIAVGEPTAASGGICPMCRIMIIRVVKEGDGGIPDSAILNGFKYITLFKRNNTGLVRVVNASLGKFQRSKAVGLMVRLLKGAGQGVLVIGAAGNEDTMTRSYPAAFADAIAVSAVDINGRKAAYSNFGVWVDIAAPGGWSERQINSSLPGSDGGTPRYGEQQGTSMAAPVVSGVAGLLLAQNPDIAFSDLRGTLIASANQSLYQAGDEHAEYNRRNYYRKVSGDNVRRPLLGAGVLDANAAVKGEAAAVAIPDLQKRVDANCGVVGSQNRGSRNGDLPMGGLMTYLLLLVIPFFPLDVISRVFRSLRVLRRRS